MNKAERKYLSRVAELGCIPCLNMNYETPQVEIHHCRTGAGMGQRSKHIGGTVGMCVKHHRTGGYGVAIHAGQKEFERIHGTEAELLAQVDRLLG